MIICNVCCADLRVRWWEYLSRYANAIGQEVEWLTRPMPGGYLHGIIVQIGSAKIKIKVQSPKTGEWKEKWAEPKYLRPLESER